MNRLSVGTFVASVVVIVLWLANQTHSSAVTPASAGSATMGGTPTDGIMTESGKEKDSVADGGALPDDEPLDVAEGIGGGASVAGRNHLANLPDLPDAPEKLRFGVVLVQYEGAQGAGKTTRTRAQALERADTLAEVAKGDFDAAVKAGDAGSVADAGRMYRGILEAEPDHALFRLDKGEVSQPIDTPRGFWIVRRLP